MLPFAALSGHEYIFKGLLAHIIKGNREAENPEKEELKGYDGY